MDIVLFLVVFQLLLFLMWVLKENIAEIQKNSSSNWDVFKFLLWSPLLFLVFTVLTVIVPLGRIYQMIAVRILKSKLGEEYCDIVKGSNCFMAADTWENSLIKSLVVVKYNKTFGKKNFFQYTKEILERRRSENKIHKKFFTTVHKFMGLIFFKNFKVEICDFLRPLPVTKNLDKEELINVLKTCFYQPLPLNGTALWDVYVGTQPLKNWKTNSKPDVEYYPLMFRTHHIVADGMSLVTTFNLLFQDSETLKPDFVNNFKPSKWTVPKVIENARASFKICVMFLSSAYLFLLHKGYDSNDLHGKLFKNEEVLQGNFDRDRVYFQKVKKIKMMDSNVSFSQILISAYSASLCEYYQKYTKKCPEYVTMALPIIRNITHVRKILSGQIDSNDTTATNQFTFLQMKLPIDISKHQLYDKSTPLISRVKIVGKVMDVLRNSIEPQFSHILVEVILGSLPLWFSQKFGQNIHNTTVGTFLPGPPKLKYSKGIYEISDCLFWIPHIMQLGIGITTITYDNHLAIAVNSDSHLKDQSEADEIVNNTYQHIDLIQEELGCFL